MGKTPIGPSKGGSFERKICRLLSLWTSEGTRDDLFWRSSASGARATVRGKKGLKTKNQYGDICAVDPDGFWFTDIFIPECKHYKNLEWPAFVFGKGFIWKTWGKLIDQCREHNRQPFMILRQNNYPEVVGLETGMIDIQPLLEKDDLTFYLLEEFFKWITPEMIKKKFNDS